MMFRSSRLAAFYLVAFCIAFNASLFAVAGEVDPGQGDWYEKYKTQKNVPDPENQLLNEDTEPDVAEGFQPLFNGKDLSGWTSRGGECEFSVREDCIVGVCVPGSPSTYLCTDREDFESFIFTCDIKWEVDGNTGVQFRSQSKPGKKGEVVFGPQVEMEGFSKNRGWSGGIYGQSCGGYFYPLWLKAHQDVRSALKKGEWNRVTVSAKDNVMKTWVNGVPASHWVDDGTYAKGFFALQVHSGSKGTILFKNIRVKELQ